MKQFYLAEITTKDKLVHQGIFYKPTKSSDPAILWVHGLGDNFYGDMGMMNALVDALGKDGWGIASFNTRGHDVITNIKKLDPKDPKGHVGIINGSSYENFSESVYDIDAGIAFLVKQGFTEVVIAGSSTGANKVCYYAGTQKDPRVIGVLLVSPISDVAVERENRQYSHRLKQMEYLIAQEKGDRLQEGISYFPLTPKRYVSLHLPGSAEDVFDYYRKKPALTVFSHIKQPLCILLAGSDEYSDRPASEILAIFKRYQRSTNFRGTIIPEAVHSMGGKEKEAVGAIARWIKTIR